MSSLAVNLTWIGIVSPGYPPSTTLPETSLTETSTLLIAGGVLSSRVVFNAKFCPAILSSYKT